MTKIFLTIVATSFYVFAVTKFLNSYRADVNYQTTRVLLEQVHAVDALTAINKAIDLNPNEPAYYRERAKAYLALTILEDTQTNKELKRRAHNDLVHAIYLNPDNLATIRNSTPTLYFLTVENLTQPDTDKNRDEEYKSKVKEYLSKYKSTYKSDLGVQVLIAKYEKKLGLEKEYSESIENIKNLRPDIVEWHPDLQLTH